MTAVHQSEAIKSALAFNQTTKQFEMSRYIDIEMYHAVERTHPYYVEMVDEILKIVVDYSREKDGLLKALELGAGTGLFTQDLINLDFVEVDALEIDIECIGTLQKHIGSLARCLQGDAVTYCQEGYYDLVLSTFAHDHIHYDRAKDFVANIRRNLTRGGLYIMGGEILPRYSTMAERAEALHSYHGYIIQKALRDGHYAVAQLEINALKSGLEMIGDFKRHEALFEEEMLSTAFKLRKKVKMGPNEMNHVGGVFVYVYEAV